MSRERVACYVADENRVSPCLQRVGVYETLARNPANCHYPATANLCVIRPEIISELNLDDRYFSVVFPMILLVFLFLCFVQKGRQQMESILQVCQLTELKQTKTWENFQTDSGISMRHSYQTIWELRNCREWPSGKTGSEIKLLIRVTKRPVRVGVHCQARCDRNP